MSVFPEGAAKTGTLDQILEEPGFLMRNRRMQGPKFVATERFSVPLRVDHA
jgi:hypothetical protein